MKRRADLSMPWPIVVQTGTTALLAPLFTEGVGEWIVAVGASLLGWMVLLSILLWMTTGRNSDV